MRVLDPRLRSPDPSWFPLRSENGNPAGMHRACPANVPATLIDGTASMFGRKKTETEDRKMSDAPDDLGIPKKPSATIPAERARTEHARTEHDGGAGARPRRARRARPRRVPSRARRTAPPPRPLPRRGCCRMGGPLALRLAPQRRRSAQADRRPRDHAVGRDKLLRQADRRRQRRSQSAELQRGRARRIGSVQGLGDDRRDRGARPLRGQSDRAQAAADPRHRKVPARSAMARSRSNAAARFPAMYRRMPGRGMSGRRMPGRRMPATSRCRCPKRGSHSEP